MLRIVSGEFRKESRLAFRRTLMKWFEWPLLHGLFRISVEGAERFPAGGPLLLVANHFHWSEPLLLAVVAPWHSEVLGARESMMHRGYGWWLRLYNVIPVEKGGINIEALKRALDCLDKRKVVTVFPEGRTHTGRLGEPWPGAAYLALKSGAPVLPVGIEGAFDAPSRWKALKRAPVCIRVGEIFGPLQAPADMERGEAVQWATREIMSRIAALLPEKRRGRW